MMPMIRRSVSWAVAGILLSSNYVLGQGAISFDQAIDGWSSRAKVVVTKEARAKLRSNLDEAIRDLRQRHPGIRASRIEEVSTDVVIKYLDRSQKDGEAPSLVAFLEQEMFGTGAVLPDLTDLPTLVVVVVPAMPADFAISINGESFGPGSLKFRVTEGEKRIIVTRRGKVACDRKIVVKKTDHPNEVSCPAWTNKGG